MVKQLGVKLCETEFVFKRSLYIEFYLQVHQFLIKEHVDKYRDGHKIL
jgi:hypothetical protein